MFLTAIVFIFLLSGLVIVHEFGHFIAARRAGVTVEQFSIFFPPHLYKRKGQQTELAIGLIPLGGYVRLYGEDSDVKGNGAFNQATVWRRLAIIVAGVAMNLITAVVLLWVGFSIGMPPVVSTPAELGLTVPAQVIITHVAEGSAADTAGIETGDVIVGFERSGDLQDFTKRHQGEAVTLTVEHRGVERTITPTLATEGPALGVGLAEATIVKANPLVSLKLAVVETGRIVARMGQFVGELFVGLFTRNEAVQQVTGPVGIFVFTGQALELGFAFVLQLAAMISVNLALVNILPFPGLDGGRALFVLLEGVAGRKAVHEKYEAVIHALGFWLLLILFVAITIRDIGRFF